MPLVKPRKGASKKVRQAAASKNIRREIKAGKPLKQAQAIGLQAAGIRKKAGPKRRKK